MRSTEWLSASRSVLGLVPRPARIAPRAAIGDRGRWAKNMPLDPSSNSAHARKFAMTAFIALMMLVGCAGNGFRYQESFADVNRKELTTDSIVQVLGEPAKVSRATCETKEGPPADTAYRYYFATRDGYPGAKIFYFYRGRWTGENVLGGERRNELFRLLDPSKKADKRLIEEWEAEHPNVW
jgi:hypothetical protein